MNVKDGLEMVMRVELRAIICRGIPNAFLFKMTPTGSPYGAYDHTTIYDATDR
jgi:hypothetical protein